MPVLMPVLGSDPMFQEFRDAVDPSTAPPLVTAMVSLAHLLIPPAVSRRARVSVGVRVVRVPVRACAFPWGDTSGEPGPAWTRRWVHKVEEERDDEQHGVARRDVLEPVRAVIVGERGYR